MRRLGLLLVSTLLSAGLALGGSTAPAFADDVPEATPSATETPTPTATAEPTPTPTPTPTAGVTRAPAAPTAAPAGYQDVTGYVTEIPDAPGTTPAMVLDVPGQGYLSIDFSNVTFNANPAKSVTVRIAVPAKLPRDSNGKAPFSALASVSSPLVASGFVASSQDSTSSMINQTSAVSATHQIYAVVVTPANVCGVSCSVTSSQSVANIRADVDAANSYWLSQSDGKVGFELVGATAWYKSAYSCDSAVSTNFTNLVNEARTRAAAQIGYVRTSNAHLVLVFPKGSNCGQAIGLGTVGSSVNTGGSLWIVGTGHSGGTEYPEEYHILAHELGHNLSLGHADWLDCSSATPSPGAYGTNGCVDNEYGDAADVMGYGDGLHSEGSLSSPQAIRSGMWSASSYAVAPLGASSHTLKPLSSAAGLRSVVVEGTSGVNYFVEYRDISGIDAPYASLGCSSVDGYCAASTAGVRVTRLEQVTYDLGGGYLYEFKGFPGDRSQLIGRTVSTVNRTNFVAGESIVLDGLTISVTSITGSGAAITVQRGTPSQTTGSVYIQPTAGSGSEWPWYAGDTLTAMLAHSVSFETTWRADSYAFQWYRDNVPIAGATSQNYILTSSDVSHYIGVNVTPTMNGSTGTSASDPFDLDLYWGYGPILAGITKGTVAIDASTVPFTAVKSGWSSGVTYTYQWRRDGAAISGATAATYTPTAADNGKHLSVKVSASKSGSATVTAVSTSKDYTLTSAGDFTIAGTPQVGQVLSTVNDLGFTTVDGEVTPDGYAYQWYRSGVAIAGATSSNYTLVAADLSKVISAKLTAHEVGYALNTVTSPATTSVIRGDILGSYDLPVVTQGAGTLVLTVALPGGSITEPGVTLNRQWFRNGVAIPLATGATYTVTAADFGKNIKARIIVTKSAYNSVALTSDEANYSVTPLGTATISGTARVGSTLTAVVPAYETNGSPASPTVAYQWYRNGVVLAGATASTYTPVAIDLGTKLSVKATASLTGFLPSVLVSPQTAVLPKGVIAGSHEFPVVTKDSATMILTAALPGGSITEPGVTTAYQWLRNGVAIAGATTTTFHLTAADYDSTVRVRVTVTKSNFTTVVLLSDDEDYSLQRSTAYPIVWGAVGGAYTLHITNGTYAANESTVTPDSIGYQWLRDGVAIAGADGATYPQVELDQGHRLSVRVTAVYAGFLTSVATSVPTEKVGALVNDSWDQPISVTKNAGTMILTPVLGFGSPGDGTCGPTGVTCAFQWYRNGVAIPLATLGTYHLTAADYGKYIAVRVTETKTSYTTLVVTSGSTNYSVTPTGALTITGNVRVGQTLTPSLPSYSTSAGAVTPTMTYQWYRNGVAILAAAGGTGATYTLVPADYSTKITVRATAVVSGFLTSSLLSAPTVAVAKGILSGDLADPTVVKNDATMVLTASLTAGSVTDSGVTVGYQWYRNGVAIVGATLPTYHLTAADFGKTVHVRLVVAKSGYTSATLLSDPVSYSVVPSTPLPVITGVVVQGQPLALATRDYAADANSATPAYQWLRDGVAIALNGTGDTYTPIAADLGHAISVRVTASYTGYLPSITTSAATQKIGANFFSNWDEPVTVTKPAGSLVLTSVPGATSPLPTYARQWYRNGVAISLATGATYTLTAADYGKSISVRVTASKTGYTTIVGTSTPTNYSVTPSGSLTITGTARVGQTLTPSLPSYSTLEGAASPTLTYQWYRNGVAIAGVAAKGATYTLVSADYASHITVRVYAAVSGYLTSAVLSPATGVVAKGILSGSFAAPTVTSNPVTMKLTAALTAGSVTDSGIATAYQWYRNGVAIYLATGSSYTLTALDYGKEIKVRLIVSKSNYTSVALYSVPVIP